MQERHIIARIEQQETLAELISKALDNLTKVGEENITKYRIETRITAMKEHWLKFSTNHDAINLALNGVDTQTKQRLKANRYFVDKIFSLTLECYLESLEHMKSCLDRSIHVHEMAPSISSQISEAQQFQGFRNLRLPRLDLPKFSGISTDWLSFKDLFTSIVLNNESLSQVEKLHYLKTSLTGSAAHLLKNTTITANNFQKAWEALISFYENKRLLVNAALNALFTIKRMTRESATEMEQLYTSMMQIYRTLDTLQRPVDSWDDFLVFIAVQRLDSDSVKAWEQHLGSSKEPPTWNTFSEFLMTRMLTLQAFERSRKSLGPRDPIPYKAHFSGQENNVPNKSCPYCSSSSHLLMKCPQFTSKTLQQKIEFVSKTNLCYNCMGFHRVSSCSSPRRCQKCGKKHHTMLHKPVLPQNQENKPTTSKSAEHNLSHQDTQ